MTPHLPGPAELPPLARQLSEDIRRRGLSAGDGYLTAAAVGTRFGVSPATANRALRLLEERGVLSRRPRRGTFIADSYQPQETVGHPRVLIFLPEPRRQRLTEILQDLMTLILNRFDQVAVQVCPIPEEGGAAMARATLRVDGYNSPISGIIAISCVEEVYRALDQSGFPLVILGGLYRGQEHLMSVDPDMAAAGQILTQHLITQGYRRLVLLQTTDARPGDDDFLNGVMEALAQEGMSANSLRVVFVSDNTERIEQRVLDLVEDQPTGFLLSGIGISEPLIDSIQQRRKHAEVNFEVVFYAHDAPWLQSVPWTHAHSATNRTQMLSLAVESLYQQSIGETINKGKHQVSVKLRRAGL